MLGLLVVAAWSVGGVVVGYFAGVIVAALGSVTNLALILRLFLPPEMIAGLLFWVGNATFLAVFGWSIGTGVQVGYPRLPKEGPIIAGVVAAGVGFALLVVPRLLLAPIVAIAIVIDPALARWLTEDGTGGLLLTFGAYVVLGAGAGLLAAFIHAGTRAPIVVIEPDRSAPRMIGPGQRAETDGLADGDER